MKGDEEEEKDVLVLAVGTVKGTKDGETISVDLKSWDGAAPKIRVTRQGKRKNGENYFGKLGGMTAAEAEGLAPLLVKAAKALKEMK